MNLNIYLEDNLGKELAHLANTTGKSKNSIIREAIKEWLYQHHVQKWPKEIMQFNGMPDFPAFEENREELASPIEDPLA